MAARMTAKQKTKRLPAGSVRVKILPKDPLIARTKDLWPRDDVVTSPTVAHGPTSARVAVIDYNADLDVRFAPARLLRDGSGFRGIASFKRSRLLDDFAFHQVNVWAIIEQTLGKLEDERALARPIPWASGLGRLLVLPHAGYQENAFYDRSTGALHFFYFQGPDGAPVYTCLSHDIITHELGHAVLDGLKPCYNEVSSAETAGFHEYFGDAMAMMTSLQTRDIALLVTKKAPKRLDAKNLVSAIASEFGAAIHGIPDEDYLRGAWNKRTMSDMKGKYEEHDWSEILTGTYYDLLQYLYVRNQKDLEDDSPNGAGNGTGKAARKGTIGQRQNRSVRALMRAAGQTANVMLRAIDYCPPVDLRYDEYARALMRADEVAYPVDGYGIRAELERIFKRRGLNPRREEFEERAAIGRKLRQHEDSDGDIQAITATPADAYRFVDKHRELFQIPYNANLNVSSVYRTKKLAASGYRPPQEQIIEFTWSEDVRLQGKAFGSLSRTLLPLYCGGTLVFDSNGNFLHMALVLPTAERKKSLLAYVKYLVREGELGITDGTRGIGAPGAGSYRISATIAGERLCLQRNAAMRHRRHGVGHEQ